MTLLTAIPAPMIPKITPKNAKDRADLDSHFISLEALDFFDTMARNMMAG